MNKNADIWPVPSPIEGELPPVDSFDEELLPISIGPMVRDAAERMSVPLDYPAIIAVLALAGTVNRRVVIEPMANDVTWLVVPNLWGGIIAPPGQMKSPLIDAVCAPVEAIQADWKQQYEVEMKEYGPKLEEYELRVAAWKQTYMLHAKKPEKYPRPPARPADEPEKPILKRIVVNDTTPEKLHEILSENPSGVLVVRDELTGWLAQLDKVGFEVARSFYLTAWNGNSTFTVDRIGRGTVTASTCVSMLGGIQPAKLRAYLADAVKDGPGNDGLMQRFQLLVWPDLVPWTRTDRAPNESASKRVQHAFEMLVRMDPETPARFKFSPDAQELFDTWRDDLEAKVRRDDEHPALIAHLSKYRSLMPSLALLFELADRSSMSRNFKVSLDHAHQAAAFCRYLESHARRIYSCIATPRVNAARELSARIKEGDLGREFTCRDIYRKGWIGLDDPDVVKRSMELLEDAHWVRVVPAVNGSKVGRPASPPYEVNPAVWTPESRPLVKQ